MHGERLQAALDGYAKFLKDKDLALANQQPCLVCLVRDLLLFSQVYGGCTFEQTLDLLLGELGVRLSSRYR